MVKGHGAYTLNEVTTVYKMYLKGSTFLVQPFYMIILVWLGVFFLFSNNGQKRDVMASMGLCRNSCLC